MRTGLAFPSLLLLFTAGCSGILGLDDFTEAESGAGTTTSTGDPGSGGAGPSTSSTMSTTSTGEGAQGPGSGGAGGAGGSTPTEIEVTPGDTKVGVLRALQFSADQAVDWSVEEADGGTIDESGRYLSPEEPGVFHVVATLQADSAVTETVEVTVAPLGLFVAGGVPAGPGYLDGNAQRARFGGVRGLGVVDGSIIVADGGSQTIRRIQGNNVTTIAGRPFTPGTEDGVGDAARFEYLGGVVGDFNGDRAWVVDGEGTYGATCIREIDLDNGAVTTVAGRCGLAGYVDAVGTNARFDGLDSITLAPSGNGLYVCHLSDAARVMRYVDLVSGAVSTVDDGPGYAMNGSCRVATDYWRDRVYWNAGTNDRQVKSMTDAPAAPTITDVVPIPGPDVFIDGLTVDTGFGNSDEIYVHDGEYDDVAGHYVSRIYRYTFGETMDPWLGGTYGYVDGPLASAQTTEIIGLVANSPFGELYFYDRGGATVRRIDPDQEEVSTRAGTPAAIRPVDGDITEARLFESIATAVGDDGTIYVANASQDDNVIRRVRTDGSIDVLAGRRGEDALADGPGPAAVFGFAFDIVRVGDFLYVVDGSASAIRRVAIDGGLTTTIAGALGERGFVDGFGSAARFDFGEAGAGIATDGTDLYVADGGNFAIRKIDLATNEVTTLAGGQEGTQNGVGPAARFLAPVGVAFDRGTLYVADAGDHVIRAIDVETAQVTTLIGQSGMPGNDDGDDGEATLAFPFRLAADGIGNLYVAGYPGYGRTVRRVSLEVPAISHFAGDPVTAGVLLGQLPGSLNCPTGLTIDAAGDLLVSDYCDDAIVAVRPL